MRITIRRPLGVALGLALLASPATSYALDASPDVTVQTLAGSGASGIADGTPGSFMMPFGVAYAPDGTIYVADATAQRIRAIDRDHRVRTIAGGGAPVGNGLWAPGGYRDGHGAEARFDRPAGVAWYDGRLYVADSYNRCIRVVTPAGEVTTLAGSRAPGDPVDGPLAVARFEQPTGIAVDAAGTLYVADFFGIRMIRDGKVTTIPKLGSTPWGVAVANSPNGAFVFAADLFGIQRRDPDGTIERYATTESLAQGTRNIQGIEPLGHPFSLAAFDPASVVYGDVRGNAVRYLNWDSGSEQILAGVDVFDGAASTAGYRDGPGDIARLDGPVGLALENDGTIVVTDAQSRRVRTIANFDRSHDVHPAAAVPMMTGPKGAYRIALVGTSYFWEYERWRDSIPGIVEGRLARAVSDRRVVVTPYVFPGARTDTVTDWVKTVLADTHTADLIVLNIATSALYGLPSVPRTHTEEQLVASRNAWSRELTRNLKGAYDELRRNGSSLLVVTSPIPENVSPSEELWFNLYASGGVQKEPSAEIGDAMNAAVRASGVPFVDGFAVFDDEERSPHHVALFGTEDEHFSPHGREVLANALATFLVTTHPWQP